MSSTPETDDRRRGAAHLAVEPLVSALHDLASCDDPPLRKLALSPLAALGHPSSIRYLTDALKHESTREAALKGIVTFGTTTGLGVLKAAADQSSDPAFRRAAVRDIGSFDLPGATEILLGYAGSSVPGHRLGAAEGLAKRPLETRVEEKVLELLEDSDSEVAVAALLALRHIGSDRATVPLLRLLQSSHNAFFRSTALLTLGRLAPNEANAAVKKYLKDPDDRIRASGVEALGRSIHDHMMDVGLLLEALKDPSNRVRGNAIVGLWELDPDACRKPFHDLMQSSRAAHRGTAAWILGQLDSPELLQAFLPVINTELDKTVVKMAVRSLAGAQNPRLAPALAKLLHHPNIEIRGVAAASFARLGRLSERPMLTAALAKETTPAVRATMVKALGRLTDSSSYSDLFPFLEDQEPRVVANALEALGRVGDLAVTPVIEDCGGKTAPLVRAFVAAALIRLGRLDAIPALADMARASERGVLEACCEAAIQIGEDLRAAASAEGRDPILEAALDAHAPAVAAPLTLQAAENVDQSADWEVPLAWSLGAPDPHAALKTLASTPQGSYLANYAATRDQAGAPAEADEKHFRSHHFLPGLFLGLERERAQGGSSQAVQERYLELADAQLAIYQEYLGRAHERTREGKAAEVFQMLDFFFRQVKLAPDLHRSFGVQYLGLKEYDLAFHHLLKAATANPQDDELLLQLAGAAIRIHKRKAAKALLDNLSKRVAAGTPLATRVEALRQLATKAVEG